VGTRQNFKAPEQRKVTSLTIICFRPEDKVRLLKEDSNDSNFRSKKLLQNFRTSTIVSDNHNNDQFLLSGRYSIPPRL